MAVLPYPRINGTHYPDPSSWRVKINGRPVLNIKEIDFSDGLEPQEVKGGSPVVNGYTRGEYKVEHSFALWLPESIEFEQNLIGTGDGLYEKYFDTNVQILEPGTPLITFDIRGIRLTKREISRGDSEATSVKYSTVATLLYTNGRCAVKNPNGRI